LEGIKEALTSLTSEVSDRTGKKEAMEISPAGLMSGLFSGLPRGIVTPNIFHLFLKLVIDNRNCVYFLWSMV
jgi:hypothetical protein